MLTLIMYLIIYALGSWGYKNHPDLIYPIAAVVVFCCLIKLPKKREIFKNWN